MRLSQLVIGRRYFVSHTPPFRAGSAVNTKGTTGGKSKHISQDSTCFAGECTFIGQPVGGMTGLLLFEVDATDGRGFAVVSEQDVFYEVGE